MTIEKPVTDPKVGDKVEGKLVTAVAESGYYVTPLSWSNVPRYDQTKFVKVVRM